MAHEARNKRELHMEWGEQPYSDGPLLQEHVPTSMQNGLVVGPMCQFDGDSHGDVYFLCCRADLLPTKAIRN